MMRTLPEELIYNLIDFARGMGRREERINSFKESQFISQNQAHIRYGKGNVTKWVKAGIVNKCNYMKDLSPLAKAEMREIIVNK